MCQVLTVANNKLAFLNVYSYFIVLVVECLWIEELIVDDSSTGSVSDSLHLGLSGSVPLAKEVDLGLG